MRNSAFSDRLCSNVSRLDDIGEGLPLAGFQAELMASIRQSLPDRIIEWYLCRECKRQVHYTRIDSRAYALEQLCRLCMDSKETGQGLGVSVADLAKLACVSIVGARKVIKRESVPGLKVARALATLTGWTLSEIYGYSIDGISEINSIY